MYIIAHFYKEDSVEVVPSTWFKNNESAWPNKSSNIKKFVTRRTIPNKFDFNFYPARQLGRKFASYEEAKSKLSTAEFKSDLSTADDERHTRQIRANKRACSNSSSPEIVKNSRNRELKSPPPVFFNKEKYTTNNLHVQPKKEKNSYSNVNNVLQRSSSYSKSSSNVNRSLFTADDDNINFEKKSSKNLDTTPTSNNNLSASHILQKSSSYSKNGSNVKRSLFPDDDNNINFEKKSSKNLDTTPMSNNNLSASHALQNSSSYYSKNGSNVKRSLFPDDDNNINFEKKSSKNLDTTPMSNNNLSTSHVLQNSSSYYSKNGSNVKRSLFPDDDNNINFEKKSSKNLDTTPMSNNNLSTSHVLQNSSSYYSKNGSNVKRSLFPDDDNNINFEKKSSKNLDTTPTSNNNLSTSHVLQKSSSYYSKSGSNVNRSLNKLLYSSDKKSLKKKNQYVPFEKHVSSCLAEIKYEIKSHTYKIDCLKEKIDFIEENLKSFKLYNRSIGTNSSNEAFADDIMFDSLISLWPLKNDDDLDEFENILQDKTKKRHCEIILSRAISRNIPITIRVMMQRMFTDNFLSNFSFIGFKGKKNFSKLRSCSLIFDSIRRVKKFENVPDCDISNPMKSWLAQANNRLIKTKTKNDSIHVVQHL